jgi:hypothetical protein
VVGGRGQDHVSIAGSRSATIRRRRAALAGILTGEWVIRHTNARQRRIAHYWLTLLWFTIGLGTWIVLRHALWFVGFMSLYAIWITHLAGWAAETPVEGEDDAA